MVFRRPVRRAGAPLVRTAAIGGAGYMAGKSAASSKQREQEQSAQIAQLQQQQQQAQAPPQQSAPAAPSGGEDVVAQLKRLAELKDAGALTQEEFDAAKQKVLAGG